MNVRSFFGVGEARSMTARDLWGSGADLALIGPRTRSGKTVTYDTALTVSAVYGSVRILADNISTLPVDSFIRQDGSRRPFRPRPEWLNFNVGPHGKIEVLGQAMTSLLLDGNAYLATYRDAAGRIVWVEVLDPAQVEPVRSEAEVRYVVGGQPSVSRLDILHIPGLMLPGAIKGVSPITAARETIGLSMAATEYGAAFFGNGAIPGGIVEAPGAISETGLKVMKSSWDEAHRGSANSNKLAILTEGAKFTKVSISPDDAQFLETRAFQIADIARIYGVPPHLLADSTGSTSWGSGLAEQNTAFVQHSLRPWVERIEQGLTTACVLEGQPPGMFVKLNVDALLRGDHERRMAAYAIGIDKGIYTVDEVRAWEDLQPLGQGDGMNSRQLAEALQKIYLAVGKVISAEEAREILNREGANLTGPAPAPPPSPAQGAPS